MLLRRGAIGADVLELQTVLVNLGYDPGPIDGILGGKTVNAVIQFQKDHGLTPDGIVGSQTWSILQSLKKPSGDIYIIKTGDTLYKIAMVYNISVASLLAANPGIDPGQLSVGQQIKIPKGTNPQPLTGDWPISGGNPANTMHVPITLSANLVLRDNPVVKGLVPLVIWNNSLYAVDRINNQKLYAVNLQTNTVKWEFNAEGAENPITWLAAANSQLYVLTPQRLYTLKDNTSQAQTVWTIEPGGSRLTYDSAALYYVDHQNNQIVARDQSSGAFKWSFLIPPRYAVQGKMSVGEGKLFVTLQNPLDMLFQLYAFSVTAGNVLWTRSLESSYATSTGTPVYQEGLVYLDLNTYITAFKALTGDIVWSYDAKTSLYFFRDIYMAVNKNSIYFLNYRTSQLMAIDKNNGVERWSVTVSSQSINAYPPISTSDKIFLSNAGRVMIYDASTGTLLRDFKLIDASSSSVRLLAIGAGLLIATDGNMLYTAAPQAEGTDTTNPSTLLDKVFPPRFSPLEGDMQTTLSLWVSEDAYVSIDVINAVNQIVRVINLGFLGYSWHDISWDGKDNQGKPVPNGKYHFGIRLTDLSGNTAYNQYPGSVVTVGDVIGRVLKNSNLRKGPGTQYDIVTVVTPGTDFRIYNESGDWYQINYRGNYDGYIAKFLVSSRSTP